MKVYLDLLNKVLTEGKLKNGRNGDTLSLSGQSIEIPLDKGFPLLTTKKIHFKSVIFELLWFLRGETNIKYLKDNGVSIWDEWADENGEVGKIYGYQWRGQIRECIRLLKSDPYSRRNVISAWNVAELSEMTLPPCHYSFQMIVEYDNTLTCIVSMRSCDIFLGLPFNIASYALLTKMFAEECFLGLNKLVINFGDLHLYWNHIEQANIQLTREPLPLPKLEIKDFSFDNFENLDISLKDYNPLPTIKAPISK